MKPGMFLALLFSGSLAALCIAPLIGPGGTDWNELFNGEASNHTRFLVVQLRLPRVLLAFSAGAALAIGGTAFQALFRNPLATPHTLGVSTTASLGAVIAIRLGFTAGFAGLSGVAAAAFTGALAGIVLVWSLVKIKGGFSNVHLLLAGVAISFMGSSMIMFVHYASNLHDGFRMMRHLMGSLATGGFDSALILWPSALIGLVFLTWYAWELDLISLGEELAISRGVSLAGLRWAVFFASCFLEGMVVALCGPIGFIGLMVPHMARLVTGNRNRHLLPASFLGGGILLTLCDMIARIVVAPAEMPVGVITALLGGPFFLWLLLQSKTRLS